MSAEHAGLNHSMGQKGYNGHFQHAWRYSLLGALIAALPVLILVQILRIQANPQQVKTFIEQGSYYSGEMHVIVPTRGQVYDRWGHLLAGNKTVYEVAVELDRVRNPETIALTLSVVLGLDYDATLETASQAASASAVHAVLTDYVSQDKVDRLQQLAKQMEETYANSREENPPSLRGLTFTPHLQRTYPENDMGSNILGFVSREGKGYFGVEEKYNQLLAGKTRTIWVPADPNRVTELPDVPDGASLILTIDRELQAAVEDVLDNAINRTGSESGTIIVMDPRNGEIMAMATTPRLNLNEYWRYSEIFPQTTPFNRAVSQAYEPGSVYKVLTMAAGLDSGAVAPETVFLDTGVFEIGGTVIHNWNGGAWGPQDMQGCMQHSLNVCLAWIASEVGVKNFYAYMQSFGIGRMTGVDLAGENVGRLKIPGDEDWYDADLGTNSFGQGVSATPIQMATASAALANEGEMMAPRIVQALVSEGHQHPIEPRTLGRPIQPQSARILTEMLANSLETESSDALVTGYRVAGKTGTAEIPTPLGYTSAETNASFVGWGPVDDPRFLVYVWLEKPSASIWGSVVAAPVFRDTVEEVVVFLNLPPDDVRLQLKAAAPAAEGLGGIGGVAGE